MRAALITALGSEPVISDDFPDVTPGPGQVLIGPAASPVNVIDLVIARGGLPVPPSPLPYVPGREGVGRVLSEGRWRGKRVWFEARGGLGGHGAQAELATADDQARELGADEVIVLDGGDDLTDRFRAAAGGRLDVIIDPLWGPAAVAALAAAGDGARHVQLGSEKGASWIWD